MTRWSRSNGRPYRSLYNIEAEQAVLGTLLLDNEALDMVGRLEREHFYEPLHGRIFEVIREMIDAGKVASPITIKNRVADDPALAKLGGVAYLAKLCGAVVTPSAVTDYAETLMDLAARRALIDGMKAAEGAVNAMDRIEVAAEYLDEALAKATLETRRRPTAFDAKGAAAAAAEVMEQAFKRGTGIDIPLGIAPLDEALGGISADEMMVIGGRPSMGKSALAIEIMRQQAERGLHAIYWSSEMNEQAVALRLMSAIAVGGPSYGDAQRGRMSEEEFRAMLEAGLAMEKLPITILDSSIRTLPAICREVRRQVRQIREEGGEIGSVIIDYMQHIMVPFAHGRFDAVTEIAMALKGLQMELGVPLIALSQLSRSLETRDNKRPMLSDLRESGQLEQDANKVLFCYRDEYYLERTLVALDHDKQADEVAEIESQIAAARGTMEVIIAKQRTGPLSTVKLAYDAAHNRIGPLGGAAPKQEEARF